MAEGFARTYGADVMHTWSAGLAPAGIVQPLTIQVMDQKNIDIRDQFPKSVDELELNAFDLIVNMSGSSMPVSVRGEMRQWTVDDPISQPQEVYVRVRDQIEGLVMQLVLDLRRNEQNGPGRLVTHPVRLMKQRDAPTGKPPVRTGLDIRKMPINPPAPDKTDAQSTGSSSKHFAFGRMRRNKD